MPANRAAPGTRPSISQPSASGAKPRPSNASSWDIRRFRLPRCVRSGRDRRATRRAGARRADERDLGSHPSRMEVAVIPELDFTWVRGWVDARNEGLPEYARGLIRYELDVTDRTVIILECRPPWRPTTGQSGPVFPSSVSATRRPEASGRSTG